VLWNLTVTGPANEVVVQEPPLGQNYAIGVLGGVVLKVDSGGSYAYGRGIPAAESKPSSWDMSRARGIRGCSRSHFTKRNSRPAGASGTSGLLAAPSNLNAVANHCAVVPSGGSAASDSACGASTSCCRRFGFEFRGSAYRAGACQMCPCGERTYR